MTEHPTRRHDDIVSFRDMVEYVAESESRFNAMRAESLIQMSNTLEKSVEAVNKAVDRLESAQQSHEKWHRDVLQGVLDRATSNRTAIISVVVATIFSGSSTLLAVLTLQHHH